ncbi:MAG: cysteine hydrolase family protein [Pseudomonadota bacterium]
MIKQFTDNTALLLIDIQKGVDDLAYYGGPTGRRNNSEAESRQKNLLDAWRAHGLPVLHTRHDSVEPESPLKWSKASGEFKAGFEPEDAEAVIWKQANSGFVGTNLGMELRRRKIGRIVIAGFYTNFCVETTTRMSGNFGYDTYLVHDACAAANRVGLDGTDYDPQLVHDLSVASLHGEFCTAISHTDAISLLSADAPELDRVQGNE